MTLPLQVAIGVGIAAIFTVYFMFFKQRAETANGTRRIKDSSDYKTTTSNQDSRSSSSQNDCCICMKSLHESMKPKHMLPCGHWVHKSCKPFYYAGSLCDPSDQSSSSSSSS